MTSGTSFFDNHTNHWHNPNPNHGATAIRSSLECKNGIMMVCAADSESETRVPVDQPVPAGAHTCYSPHHLELITGTGTGRARARGRVTAAGTGTVQGAAADHAAA